MRVRRRSAVIVGVVGGLVLLGAVGYLGAGLFLYDALSQVTLGCGPADSGGGPRFADVTPTTLGYSTRDFGAGDTAGSFILGRDLSRYRVPTYDEVSFASRASAGIPTTTIRGWWVPGPQAESPAVILVHGRGSCRKDWGVLLPAGMLHRAGFATLSIDLRNQGASDLTVGPTRGRYYGGVVEYLDVLGAWDWLVGERGLAPGRIGLFGTSLGAGSVMIAAAREPRVAAVWEDSGYADIPTRIGEEIDQRYHLPLGFVVPAGGIVAPLVAGVDLYGESPLKALAAFGQRPLAIVHGAADTATLPHHAQDLYEEARRLGVDVEMWMVPYAAHTWGVLVAPDEYERRLGAFFGTHLGLTGH